jgi:bacterioferritin-associated ferredoxin
VIDARARAYLERLADPVGLADLAPADVAGETGSVVGGSGVRVTIRFARGVGSARTIEAAAFRPFGSPAARAPGSVLVESLRGRAEALARALAAHDLLAPLGTPVPDSVVRAAEHLVEALGRALGPGGAETARASAPGVLVCRCLGVGDRAVRRAIRGGARDVVSVGAACSAGHGCRSCWPDLASILREELPPPPADSPRPATPLERAADAVVRPVVEAQGVPLVRVRFVGNEAFLAFGPRAPTSLASEIGAAALARHALREALGEDVRASIDVPAPA